MRKPASVQSRLKLSSNSTYPENRETERTLGNDKQLIVPYGEPRKYVLQGFESMTRLDNIEAIIKLPNRN